MEASKKRIGAQTWNGSLLLLLTREVWSTRSATGHAALRSYLASFPANSCAFQSLAWMNVVDAVLGSSLYQITSSIIHLLPKFQEKKIHLLTIAKEGRTSSIAWLLTNSRDGRTALFIDQLLTNSREKRTFFIHQLNSNGRQNIFHRSAQLKGKNEHCSSISSTQREERTLFIDQLNSKGRTNTVHRSAPNELKGK